MIEKIRERGKGHYVVGCVIYLVEKTLAVVGPGYETELCETDHFR